MSGFALLEQDSAHDGLLVRQAVDGEDVETAQHKEAERASAHGQASAWSFAAAHPRCLHPP